LKLRAYNKTEPLSIHRINIKLKCERRSERKGAKKKMMKEISEDANQKRTCSVKEEILEDQKIERKKNQSPIH